MKRSEINRALKQSDQFFEKNGWTLPPNPKWDITDFGLGNFNQAGLVLVNLCEEPEYCEKLMYARKEQETPMHYHKKKKEDIICRTGVLSIFVWSVEAGSTNNTQAVKVKINGQIEWVIPGQEITLQSGERITLYPETWHRFYPKTEECIIGEVSTQNDDLNDNFFQNPKIGRFSEIEEDEPVVLKLIGEK